TVEHHLLDAGRLRTFGDELADRVRRLLVGAGLQLLPQVLLQRRRGRDRNAAGVVDHLRIDVLAGAEHGEPGPTAGLAQQPRACPLLPTLELLFAAQHDRTALLLLAFLTEDGFLRILDALALVGLRLAECTDLGRNLPDPLLVDAGDRHRRRPLAPDLHVFRDRVIDVVAIPELQLEDLALDRGTVAHTVDLQVPGEPFAHAPHERIGQAPIRAPHHPSALGVALRLQPELRAFHARFDLVHEPHRPLAELALGADLLSGDFDRRPTRDRNGVFTYARHRPASIFLSP